MAGSQNGDAAQAAPAATATQTPTTASEVLDGSFSPRKNGRDDEDAGRSKRQRRRRARSGNHSAAANGTSKGAGVSKAHGSKNNGSRRQHRRHSISKAARDPRDEPAPTDKSLSPTPDDADAAAVSVASAIAGSPKTTRSPSPVIDFDGLSRPSIGTRNRLEEGDDERAKRLDKIRGAVRTILECVGEDPDRAGLVRTPDRYARALLDFTQGYQQNVRNIVNNAIFHEGHNEMVIVKDIEVYSLCEHHMVPFTGKMHIGYIPFHSVIGISKLPRIAEMFSRRLQIQERLTKDVANTIMEILQPQGVAVVMESSHLCMVMRGVQKTTATTITSCVLGCFESKEKTRNEFLNLVGLNRS